MRLTYLLLAPWLLAVQACQTTNSNTKPINEFFDVAFQERLINSPQMLTRLGIKQDYDKLDDISEASRQGRYELSQRQLRQLKQYQFDELSSQEQLSYRLFEKQLQREIERYQFRDHNYPVNQMFGLQSSLPSFMISMHRIDEASDAEAYVARLNEVERLFDQLIINLKRRENQGIIPPKFVFPSVLRDSQNIISGYPFEKSEETSTLFQDFKDKIAKLELSTEQSKELESAAKNALLGSVKPAYQKLIAYMTQLEDKAPAQAPASALPNGEAYYQFQLRSYTTTDWDAETIHQLGLQQVERIHQQMRAIQRQVGVTGSLSDFFTYMSREPKFYFPQTEQGREAYLSEARDVIEAFKKRMPEAFGILPKADVEVRAVESFREESAGIAFYNAPALDGSRPGIYYVNLHDLKQVPRYELEALAYHEALPGHHLQLAIAQELEGLPRFRSFSRYTAFTEGWALYAELLPKEMGFYQDPYSDFGRLSMELWRACRLVVDTALHAKAWTREQAIDYLAQNTPASQGEIVKAIERYIIMPGQATAYLIGSLKIQELRDRAREALGDEFRLADFHDQILQHGALPLTILEEKIDAWLKQRQVVASKL